MIFRPWNYLRVRGEYSLVFRRNPMLTELPPRARRIQSYRGGTFFLSGTTSACAENTRGLPLTNPRTWNYLRVRGEYPK